MVRRFQWGILEKEDQDRLFAVHAKMYSKLWKRVKGCTIPILADVMLPLDCLISNVKNVMEEHASSNDHHHFLWFRLPH